MAILQKEKLLVIKKELLHLWHISDFYKSKDGTPNNEKSQREKISEKIYDDINAHLRYIEKLNKDITDYYEQFGKRQDEFLSFLTMYDFYNQEIKELLIIVQHIQSKFLQFQQEHFNQYMPVPNINKRYSSKGFLDYLKDYHTEILENENENIEHPITLWGHTDSFRAHHSLGKSEKRHERYVEIPYWNYEIPFMLPIITHEIGHVILDYKKTTALKELKEILQNSDDIKKIFEDKEGFLDEILSDIFAFIHHGEAYLIAVTHELLGMKFSDQFYSKNKNEPVAINPIDLDKPKFLEALIRLKILISLSAEGNPIINELKEILNWIILEIEPNEYEANIIKALKATKNKQKTNLAKIYHHFYNLDQEYIDFHYTITKYTQVIEKELANENRVLKIIEKIIKRIDTKEKNYFFWKKTPPQQNKLFLYKESFNDLSKDRINLLIKNDDLEKIQIELKNKLRKIILTKEDVLVNHENKDIGSAYELVMFKTRMDRFDQKEGIGQNYIEILSNEIKKTHNTILINKPTEQNELSQDILIEPKLTFDYYSMLSLVKKRESITVSEMNRYLEYKPNNKIAKYYTNKYSLILLERINNKQENNSHQQFSAFINLSLKYNNSDQTKIAIEEIKQTMKKDKFKQINYEIYKSLGPKEMVVHLHNCTINTLFDAKRELFQDKDHKVFHRSYTIIYADPKDIDKLQIESPYYCGSSLRVKTNTHDENFEDSNIHSLLMTTGVKDYTVQWKPNTPITSIVDYYNELAKNEKCTDVQTFLMKRIEK